MKLKINTGQANFFWKWGTTYDLLSEEAPPWLG